MNDELIIKEFFDILNSGFVIDKDIHEASGTNW